MCDWRIMFASRVYNSVSIGDCTFRASLALDKRLWLILHDSRIDFLSTIHNYPNLSQTWIYL